MLDASTKNPVQVPVWVYEKDWTVQAAGGKAGMIKSYKK